MHRHCCVICRNAESAERNLAKGTAGICYAQFREVKHERYEEE